MENKERKVGGEVLAEIKNPANREKGGAGTSTGEVARVLSYI